jgi:ABC-2 type transport system permease protein
MAHETYLAVGERRFGIVNWMGVWTLYCKEVQRFIKVGTQTVAAPVVSTLLFLLIFQVAIGKTRGDVGGVPFMQFLAPGLVMMSILTNAFANSSSSLLMAKMQGTLVDVLMPPLSPLELTVGYVGGAATRGLLVAIVTAAAMIFFVSLTVQHWWAVIFYALSASFLLSQIGVIAGIWAEKFDHMSAITNFIVTPLIFLSGTFYSVTSLPKPFLTFTQWNPIFYMIDGFRYGMIGQSDGSIALGVSISIVLNVIMAAACYRVFKSGYKLKT